MPPEIAKSGWETIKRHPLSATDSFGLGVFIFEVFNSCTIQHDQVGQIKNVPFSMHQSYKRLLNANPKARVSISHFRDQGRRSGGFFETPLIKLSEGLDSLGLKSDGEREEFLRLVFTLQYLYCRLKSHSGLDEVAEEFPEEYFCVKVLPELLKSVEFGGGGPKVFASVMKIGKKISDEEWETRIIPVIVRLFSNPDRAIRVCLLDNLPSMIEHLSQKIVNDKVFPQMVTGFTDVAPLVREQTVKAVLTIVVKLSDRTINGELLKHLAKTSNDEQPGIRTNTTICLGKIARNLGVNTRQKVLIAAFARPLRDPFVHARNAALLALAATSDLFSEDDCANKILPALCPSLIDKEKIVRDQANKTFDVYLQRVRKHGSSLPDSVLPPPSTVAANGNVPCIGTPQNDSAGWAGWAISSFTNKSGTASGEMQPKIIKAGVFPSDRSSSIPPVAGSSRKSASHVKAPEGFRQVVTETSTPARASSPTNLEHSNSMDDEEIDAAWGEIVDDFTDGLVETKPTKETSVNFDDGGEPDFEGWLNAQAQAKSKTALPKGLAKPSAPPITRTTTTGSVGSGTGPKKLANAVHKPTAVAAKTINTKPKETAGDDDWGDAWD